MPVREESSSYNKMERLIYQFLLPCRMDNHRTVIYKRMFEACSINADHKDLIHDVAYDFYGERMATCSSDQFVKIWDQDAKGNWQLSASWKAHSGSVWKVTWAHPEFGQVIATCSFDRTAAVWEESGEMNGAGERGKRLWSRRTSLGDSRTSVTDIKFGPKTLGLLIATCSLDGIIRIYEAPDVMNLAQWTLQHEIPTKVSLSCLTWNPSLSRGHPPMVAAGSSEGGRIVLLEYSESTRRWARVEPQGSWPSLPEAVNDLAFAPNLGRSYHLLAVATSDVRILALKPSPEGGGRYTSDVAASLDQHGAPAWRVCWNVTGTLLASSGDDATVRLWKMQYQQQWVCAGVLQGEPSQSQSSGGPPASSALAGPSSAARYYKLGVITNPGQVPWH